MVVLDHSAGQGCKQLLGAVDLGLLNRAQVQAIHRALRLSDEVDVADSAFMEHNRPVCRVVSDRRGNGKALRQLGIDVHILGTIQLLDELALDALLGGAVREHKLLYRPSAILPEHFVQLPVQRPVLRIHQRIQFAQVMVVDDDAVIEAQQEAHGDAVDNLRGSQAVHLMREDVL